MKLSSLNDLYVNQLLELYRAEQESIEVLARMREASLSVVLSAAFEDHRRRAQAHVLRLEEVFDARPEVSTDGHRPGRAMHGLLEECLDLVHEEAEPHVRDAVLIALAQRLEHEEIAGYGCARTWARLLGDDRAAGILQRSLDDAREIDQKLTVIARDLNHAALVAGLMK